MKSEANRSKSQVKSTKSKRKMKIIEDSDSVAAFLIQKMKKRGRNEWLR